MTYATVMVSLALDQANEGRLQVAGELAERFEAAVIGVAAAQYAPPLYFADGAAAQKVIDEGEASVKQRLADLETQFRGATRNRGGHVEWRGAVDFPVRHILQQARCADIIVSGGRSPAFSDVFALASPKDLVMQAGRPVLVVPNAGPLITTFRRVLLAWNGSKEAARAAFDALPFIAEADKTDILVIDPPETPDETPEAAGAEIAAALSRHGANVSVCVQRSDGTSVDDIIQARITESGADLLVLGAYSHSWLRQLLFGGVTRTVLRTTNVAAFLSR